MSPEKFEALIESGLKDVVVKADILSDADKEEIAQKTRDLFRTQPLA